MPKKRRSRLTLPPKNKNSLNRAKSITRRNQKSPTWRVGGKIEKSKI